LQKSEERNRYKTISMSVRKWVADGTTEKEQKIFVGMVSRIILSNHSNFIPIIKSIKRITDLQTTTTFWVLKFNEMSANIYNNRNIVKNICGAEALFKFVVWNIK